MTMDAKTIETIATGRVAIYTRCSLTMSESSIEAQAQRARDAVLRAGGDATKAVVFSDVAVSGIATERPALDALLRAADEKRVDVVLTDDESRFSRDGEEAERITECLRSAGVAVVTCPRTIDETEPTKE